MKSKLIIRSCFAFLFISIAISCNSRKDTLTAQQLLEVKKDVQKLMDMTAKDISTDGPTAWLNYFENTPDFFMVSDGQLVFPNYDSATSFIQNTLVKQIKTVELKWSDVRIDPLTDRLAVVAATWNEDLTDFAGNTITPRGYFTAVAERTSQQWKFRNAHWSLAKPK